MLILIPTRFLIFQALTISCVVLHYKSLGENDEMTILLVAGTFVGYSIILIGLFAGKIINHVSNIQKLLLFHC